MEDFEKEFGKPNSNAPAELSRFGFLIGNWRCDAKVKVGSGEWQTFEASWAGRFILDGYVIADEYRMTSSSGDLIVLGMNFRVYDPATQVWNIKWLHATTGTWTDLGAEQMGGVRFEGESIVYAFKEPMAAHAYTRARSRKRTSPGWVRGLKIERPGVNLWLWSAIGAMSRTSPCLDG